jgi:hypothetical protein
MSTKTITKLYHGTSDRYLSAILSKGLIPRGRRKGNWQKVPSRPGAVYLTKSYPFQFAFNSMRKGTEKLVVFEVALSKLSNAQLEPDEDFIAWCISHDEGRPLVEANAEVRQAFRTYSHLWTESLAEMGCCAYRGAIPASAITRYCLLDLDHYPSFEGMMMVLRHSDLDPADSMDGHQQLVQLIFGDRGDLPLVDFPCDLDELLDRSGIEVVTLHGNVEEDAA